MPLSSAHPEKTPVLLLTGLSGAGKSHVLKVLEDIGYETIDNLPLSLLETVITSERNVTMPLAIDIDIRSRDFASETFLSALKRIKKNEDIEARLIFIDADDDILARRYNETRRRHPLAHERPVLDGIRHERQLMLPLRESADLVIDTSRLNVSELKGLVRSRFPLNQSTLSIFVTSFSYRYGPPREADIVFDARLLKNPHYDPELQPLTGRDPAIGEFIEKDEVFDPYWEHMKGLLDISIPRFETEGRTYLTIGIGCTGGKHRSVFLTEKVSKWLKNQGKRVKMKHRDITKGH
ncbi:RNase adaptor protein RapZ [Candidatus Bealeia paramacronuclearis]|uniref:RNase adaptor protein RapZ n=1 Tax=Candidatus Bealeia paramacronuclearis TaxID=1921001 RepID=A0ABZ2C5W7_9PROT|nr:RNase adaptor protein RapZ [Candidatus Bealeia paramacronuclearis]